VIVTTRNVCYDVGLGREEDSWSWASDAWSDRPTQVKSWDHSWRLWHWCWQVVILFMLSF